MKRKTLSNTYLSMFCTELAMLLDAGLTVSDSIQVLHQDNTSAQSKAVMSSLYNELLLGSPLSKTLDESGVFPKYMIHMIEVGEKTGRLTQTLNALAEHYERQTRLSVTIKNSVLYPAILLLLMIVVVLVLIVQVLPIFNDIYARLGAQMDPLAVRFMQFGGWLSNAAVGIAIAFTAFFAVLFVFWLAAPIRKVIVRAFADRWGDKGIFGRLASSRFVYALTLAMASGMDIADSIDMAAKVSGGSRAVNDKHRVCVTLLESGKTLSESLSAAGILSAQDAKMLSVGSISGRADFAMAEIARRSDISVRDSIDRIVAGVEPTLVILSSVVVGVILLSVMLPLMGIMTAIG